MNKFAVIRYDDEDFRHHLLSSALVNDFERECPFHIASIKIADFTSQRVLVASASSAQTGFGSIDYLFTCPYGFLVFDGFPVFKGQNLSMPWAERLFRLFRRHGVQAFYEMVQGEYCYVAMVDGKIFSSGDFAGLSPCFYLNDGPKLGISNRQRLLQRVLRGAIEIDPCSIAWLTGHGNIFGNESPYAGVKLIEPGRFVKVAGESLKVGGFQRFYAPADRSDAEPSPESMRRAVAAIHEQADLLAELDIDPGLRVDVTGGMDSRAVVGICLATQLGGKVELFQTTGPEGSPEIEVATALAQAAGLNYAPIYSTPSASQGAIDLNLYWSRIRNGVAVTDGSVMPHTSVSGISQKFIPRLTGTAGEIYRPHSKIRKTQNFRTLEEVQAMAERYQGTPDPFKIQTHDYSEWQRLRLRQLARDIVQRGARYDDVHFGLYVENRLPWWAGYTRANAMGTRRLGVLANRVASEEMFRCSPEQKKIDRLHFELMKTAHPALLKVPFLNNMFDPRLAAYAPGFEFASEPFAVKHAATAPFLTPWMFDFVARDHERIFDYIFSRNNSPIFSVIDKNGLKRNLKNIHQWRDLFHSVTSLLAVLSMRIAEDEDWVTVRQGRYTHKKVNLTVIGEARVLDQREKKPHFLHA